MHTPLSLDEQEELLSRLADGSADMLDVHNIVHLAVAFTVRLLRRITFSRGYSFEASGLTIEDIGFDIIAETLADGDTGPCAELVRGMNTTIAKNPPGQVSRLGAFHAVLITTVHQRLGRYFAHADPVRGQLRERLRKWVSRSKDHIQVIGGDGRFYLPAARMDSLVLEAMHFDELEQLFSSLDHRDASEYDLLKQLLEALDALGDVRVAVRESDFLQLIMCRVNRGFEDAQTPHTSFEESEGTNGVMELIDSVINEMAIWVNSRFVAEGKLSQQEGDAVLRAAREYLVDGMHGDTDSHYVYLKRQIPDLTHARYRQEYHNRTGYIFNKILTTVGKRLLYREGADVSAMKV